MQGRGRDAVAVTVTFHETNSAYTFRGKDTWSVGLLVGRGEDGVFCVRGLPGVDRLLPVAVGSGGDFRPDRERRYLGYGRGRRRSERRI